MVQDEATRVTDLEELLDDFGALPGRVERPRTFMEIAGYPHYENVCSNILKFFMDPEEPHGLRTLVLDALASAVGIDVARGSMSSNVAVDREISTDAGNRIDILITSDTHAVLIENKIYATANNPFDDYAAYLDRVADGRNKRKILLTLYPINAGSNWGFTNLTYEELVGQIRSLMGNYVVDADTRHLTMFLDFLNTLENLRRGTRMDKEFVKLLAKRGDEIETFYKDVQRFGKELKEKAINLQRLIDANYPSVEARTASRGPLSFTSVHEINVAAEDLSFHINTNITPRGWDIDFDYYPATGDFYSRLGDFLRRMDIPFEDRERYGWIYPTRFDYDEDLEEIRPVLQELVDKLATSQERAE